MLPLYKFVSGRQWLKTVIDGACVILGYLIALSIRFEFVVPSKYLKTFPLALPAVLLVFLLMNHLMKMYSGRWKYAGFDELLNLVSAAAFSTAIVLIGVYLIPGSRKAIPISVAVMGGVVSLFAMAFVRLQFRLFIERGLRLREPGSKKVLLIGAGESGEMVVRDMFRHPEYDYHPVGFIDDDPAKSNLVIQSVPVLGNRKAIPKIARRHDIDEIFITIPSVTGEKIREILPYCEETGAEIKILPGIVLTMTGEVGLSSVRELRLEDLLGRKPVETDISTISAYIEGKTVLITGAGGSIGSELARQLCKVRPGQLVLLDNDETSLYEMELEMAARDGVCDADVVVADIRDCYRLEEVFSRFKPHVVFHSAALKHVPMMELNPSEAVKTNVLGTRNLAEQAIKHGAERFILISTDKAVQPASIMGATKRISELIMKSMNGRNGTLFSVVRFGNVLGSRGSVVPVFQKQIEQGGPVLVTHPDIERYFMTIEEAAQLVMQAGAFTEGGDVFILDMGEPIRIMDLAKQMVRMLGNGKNKNIEIRTTDLRPGEKLHETLLFETEERLPTHHAKIDRVVDDFDPWTNFDEQMRELADAAKNGDSPEILRCLIRLLPNGSM